MGRVIVIRFFADGDGYTLCTYAPEYIFCKYYTSGHLMGVFAAYNTLKIVLRSDAFKAPRPSVVQ